MAVRFTKGELEIFEIKGFKARMAALRKTIRPKLEKLGDELGPLLMNQFKREFFAHTAKHLRRTVNPPEETWVALGPQARGYKAHVHFAFCIGRLGSQARLMLRKESLMRPDFGRNLLTNKEFLLKRTVDFKGLTDYTVRDKHFAPKKIKDFEAFLEETGGRLSRVKSAYFDAGFELNPTSPNLTQQILKAFDLLFPFYECGLQRGIRFS